MSLLAIQLPPRSRLGPRAAAPAPAGGVRLPTQWNFVFSADGRTPTRVGQSTAALLPKADSTVLVLAEADVSWHLVTVPKAPPARLPAALLGLMEEALLDDDEALHFALAPDAAPGRSGWVAVTDARRLAAALSALEEAGRSIERVLPAAVPVAAGTPARGHFHVVGGAEVAASDDQPWLTLARTDGVLSVRLAGGLARALLPAEGLADVRWSTTPAAATAAEQLLGGPVPLMAEAERVLEAARGPVDLRQFQLATRHRGTRALREAARRFLSADWRPVRMGLVTLLVLHLAGLNVYAWQQRQALASKRAAMTELLRATHPGVRAVLDAPIQMERETERLRTAAGRAGAVDLETMLSAAAAAWPDGSGPVQTLRFEPGRLTLSALGWAQPQVQQFRERLHAAGYAVEMSEGRAVVTRPTARSAS